ncbi:mediator of RNA polymerase II transcription subunit 1 isoform X2 [Topomyia yanbarensis]|uniref:mediator of RNA polymerase II transcription subunit 1 isoform X2 n=1 Tax=Topomyia yanbarensis TaxID=2498891 RepID=UPI00273BAE3A|nr:mediator of RNA polymerase II transcription subunit 1 isoform X2 [Topomyia yanbarensis]
MMEPRVIFLKPKNSRSGSYSNKESTNSSHQILTPAGAPVAGSNITTSIGTNEDADELNATSSQTVTIMDQMNNVVTTTTTATAIASTVHQQTSAVVVVAPTTTTIGYHRLAAVAAAAAAPPAFSRLPPDGHEFPPNFSEPSVATMTVINGGSTGAPIGAKGDKHSSYDDIPDLPKSHPPPVPRKVYRQDLVLKALDQNLSPEAVFKKPPVFPSSQPTRSNSLVAEHTSSGKAANGGEETRRRSFDIHEINKPPTRVTLVGSNWRKDEKSERSVRDKIAMFSNGSGGSGGGGGGGGGSENEGSPVLRKFSKDFTKSSENLLGVGDGGYSRKGVDPIEAYATLRKKAHSVENLDEVDSIQNGSEFKPLDNGGYKTKFSLETSKPVVLGKAYSVENLNPSNGVKTMSDDNKLDSGGLFGNAKLLSRTTSFSGYSNGNSLASINNNVEERRKSSITNLLEQRKKSMSKLRGLVIPEKVPETEVLPDSKIIGLPIIKSKDSEKILSSNVLSRTPDNAYARKTATLPTPSKSNGSPFTPMVTPKPSADIGGTYKSIFRNLNGSSVKSEPKAEIDEDIFRRPIGLVPPAKPPRTSLAYPPPKGLDQRSQTTEDESDDSDSVLSSRVSSPPVSPVAPSPPENSGSQASCSSVGSTPAIDMSRRISKSSSSEMSMNRKNVLASAKSRSGRGDLKIEDAANGKSKRYEDGDSTDGYEEEERRKSKSKPRGSISNGKNAANGLEEKELTHYKVVDTVDSIVDKVIKVASYVEVVSDIEENASVDTEVVIPMQKPIEPVKEKISFSASKSISVESGTAKAMSDLAKWVRHEAAKTIVNKETDLPARSETKKYARAISDQAPKVREEIKPSPVKRELRSSVDSKKLNLAEIRKSFEAKSNNSTVVPSPVKTISKEHSTPVGKTVTNQHDRFSSWDSLASSSSGVSSLQANSLLGNAVANCTGSSQTLQSTPSDYGSFSSLGSSHSLITPQDLQLIIEEADPPLAAPEAFVIVLQRETPESSIGITLAGGSDYEAKEITIHKILNNSPAEKDGRLRRGDRILSINGLSMRGLTHRESLSVLKTPRPEVVMVITRSKSLVVDNSILGKTKRPSLGSLSSLAEKNEISDYERKMKIQHKASRSLDLDLDIVSNEAESVFDGTASEDGLLSADESKCSSITPASDKIVASNTSSVGNRVVDIVKDGAGLGFSIEGGFDSPTGNKPLLIKKIFMGGAAEKSGLLKAGDEIVAINEFSIERMTRIQVWNMMKKLPNGGVRITLK